MYRTSKVIRPVRLNTRQMSTSKPPSHVMKNYKDWWVRRDPVPDNHCVYFTNAKLDYHSYNPPSDFTADEILQFNRAKETFETVEEVNDLLKEKEKLGSLDMNDFWNTSSDTK